MKINIAAIMLMTVFTAALSSCGNAENATGNTSAAIIPVATPATTSSPQPVQINPVSGVKITFIELGSVNCVPCKMMQPIMREIGQEYAGQVKVVFHDVWTPAGEPFARTYRIRVIPTQVFLDANGKEYYRHEGFFPKEELIKILQQKGVR
ncbi:MAG: thioredoxin [Spirochaetaceae bacterium]|nr:MAG: thioredoxin [Spirochaetaceae bacterium]